LRRGFVLRAGVSDGSQGFGLSRERYGRCRSSRCARLSAAAAYQAAKLGPWLGVIDAILEDDKQRPASSGTQPSDLRAIARRAWVYRWLHDREGLRAVGGVAQPGGVSFP